jgi:hypothetical protein
MNRQTVAIQYTAHSGAPCHVELDLEQAPGDPKIKVGACTKWTSKGTPIRVYPADAAFFVMLVEEDLRKGGVVKQAFPDAADVYLAPPPKRDA